MLKKNSIKSYNILRNIFNNGINSNLLAPGLTMLKY